MLPAWIFTCEPELQNHAAHAEALRKNGSRVFNVPVKDGHLSLAAVLATLAEEGITRLLVEAGGTLATAFMRERFVDRLYWFRAPVVIGENGLSAVKGHDLPLAQLPKAMLRDTQRLGDDVLEIYDCRAA
jgi:diaminohydroxyphosphoribosylaminopyrimidine deaminase/5-amino-6-(5-phosphoribosylamino)uracil reductase